MDKQPVAAGEKRRGLELQFTKKDGVSKVVIKVESKVLTDHRSRMAAFSRYHEDLRLELNDRGFKISTYAIPHVNEIDFKTPVVGDYTFANEEGATLRVRKRVFFTTRGYDVTVFADSERDFRLLSDWAARIRPAAPDPGR